MRIENCWGKFKEEKKNSKKLIEVLGCSKFNSRYINQKIFDFNFHLLV
jgi:hypothetical protein